MRRLWKIKKKENKQYKVTFINKPSVDILKLATEIYLKQIGIEAEVITKPIEEKSKEKK